MSTLRPLPDPPASLAPLLPRLAGVTGFVSILGVDPRVEVYGRLDHVHRVVRLAEELCDRLPRADRQAVRFMAWAHDLNRLPFAHNLEKAAGFDQASQLPEYLRTHGIVTSAEILDGVVAMLNKDLRSSLEARVAYAADAATGFVEDPLLALSTLGLGLEHLPARVADAIGLDPGDAETAALINSLSVEFDEAPRQFRRSLAAAVYRLSCRFIDRQNRGGALFVDLPEFGALRHELKEDFLRARVFPLNNERISQGTRLAQEVALPLMAALRSEGLDPVSVLLDWTDQDTLVAAHARGIIRDPDSYHPLLPSRKSHLGV